MGRGENEKLERTERRKRGGEIVKLAGELLTEAEKGLVTGAQVASLVGVVLAARLAFPARTGDEFPPRCDDRRKPPRRQRSARPGIGPRRSPEGSGKGGGIGIKAVKHSHAGQCLARTPDQAKAL